MAVNVEANLLVMQACHALLKLAPRGGRIVVIGSKNVPAPGPGAAAYSASKAALNQLARVAALEWAKDGIRINSLHPNAVYDTALWTEEVLASRAKAYNLTVEQYKKNNLLRTEVASKDVAELAAEMCGRALRQDHGGAGPRRRRERARRLMSGEGQPIRWRGDRLELLDQRLFPEKTEYIICRSAEDVALAIRDMVVRGAPAIGCAAAFGVVLGKEAKAYEILAKSRPTAVNLFWALERMKKARDLEAEARAIYEEDLAANRAIGKFGAELIPGTLARDDPLQYRRAGDRRATAPRWASSAARERQEDFGHRQRDAALSAGRAAHGVGAGAGGHPRAPSSPTAWPATS